MVPTLQEKLRDFLNLTHAYAWNQAKLVNKTPDEPGLVSAFLAKPMLSELESIVKNHYQGKGIDVVVNGIFTHKTPTVHPDGAPNSVEIADLLFVRQHVNASDPTTPIKGKAFLLQAKRNTTPSSGNVENDNPRIQYDLYKSWPSFTGTSRITSGPTGPGKWDFKPTQTVPYGRYLAVLDEHAFDIPSSQQWTGAPTLKNNLEYLEQYPGQGVKCTWAQGIIPPALPGKICVECNSDFSEEFTKFIDGQAGVKFVPGTQSSQEHWSTFVTDMLNIAALTDYKFRSHTTGVNVPQLRNGEIHAFLATAPIAHAIQKTANGMHFFNPIRLASIGLLPRRYFYDLYALDIDHKNKLLFKQLDNAYTTISGSGNDSISLFEREYLPDDPGHVNILSVTTFGETVHID